MTKLCRFTTFILIAMLSTNCQPKKDANGDNNAIASGDIVISNSGSKALLLFDSSGAFKQVLGSLDNSSNGVFQGIRYNSVTGQLLAVIDGTADSVRAFDMESGSDVGDFISNSNLTGNLRGITQLTGGDLLIVESNNVERFSSAGERRTLVNSVVWPKALHNTANGIVATSDGFILCSNGTSGITDRVTKYDSDGANGVDATASSPGTALTGTTGVTGCAVGPDGSIYAAFIGSPNSYVRKYSADLTTEIWTHTSPMFLNPTDLAIRSDGSVLVLNSVMNHVVQINADGSDSHVLRGSNVDLDDLLSTPQFIYIVP